MKHDKKTSSLFFSYDNFFWRDTIKIYAHYSECGEWGGHEEFIKIFLNDKVLYANYKKYKINCKDCSKDGDLNQKIQLDTIVEITEKRKESLNTYFHQFIDSKFSSVFPGNAGDYFSIVKSDSTLVLIVYGNNQNNVNNYNDLVMEIIK